MTDKATQAPPETDLLDEVTALLADPAHSGNPLREPLARLVDYTEKQRGRLGRLLKISDGYYGASRSQSRTVTEQYERQLKRLEKLARISDRYQNSLRELSEALKDASLRDPLTGMGNRRFLMERMHEETERANRKSGAYALAIIDVDRFKSVNDRFGHDVGDKALCKIAKAIPLALREYDLCGRWGGEEFLILMPETTLDFACQVAERVRLGIAGTKLEAIDENITASLGVSVFRPGEHFSDTLNRADAALLRAKETGRNRIEIG